MNFRSDSQRKAMFANIFGKNVHSGKNSFSRDNTFALVPLDKKYRKVFDDLYDSDWAEEETILHDPLEKIMRATDETSKDDDLSKTGIKLIVDDDDNVQGLVKYNKPSGGYLFIDRIIVFPDERGKGVGSGALKEILESEPDAEYIVGDSDDKRSDEFWESVGAELSHPYGDRYKNARILLDRKKILNDEVDDVQE